MFEFTREVIDLVLGYSGWNIVVRILVFLMLPVLLPFAIFMDILFGILYLLVDVYYWIF